MELVNRTDEIAILLCTHHGERFLSEQLKSFESQDHKNWKLYVSDDSKNDQTYKIILDFQRTHPKDKVHLRSGKQRGFAQNFLSLACDEMIIADYYAFSDQDDVWKSYKLSKAVAWLKTVPENVPALYCSRTQLINAKGENLRLSNYFKKPPNFANALVQNIAGGNTIVFNHATKKLLMAADTIDVSAHDWWVYVVVTASGGKIFYDADPTINYRQHENNTIGIGSAFNQRLKSLKAVMNGQFQKNNDIVIKALQNLEAHITPANKKILKRFQTGRKANLFKRLLKIYNSGVHRQTLAGNLALAFTVFMDKV